MSQKAIEELERQISVCEKWGERLAKSQLLPEHYRGRRKGGTFTAYDPETVAANVTLGVSMATAIGATNIQEFLSSSYIIGSNVDFDGRTYAAVANASGELSEQLDYEFHGSGMDRHVIVTGKLKGENKTRSVELHITGALAAGGKDSSPEWKSNPDQMLCYAGARQWVKRHLSKVLLGMTTPDSPSEAPEEPASAPKIEAAAVKAIAANQPSEAFTKLWIKIPLQNNNAERILLANEIERAKMTDEEREKVLAELRKTWEKPEPKEQQAIVDDSVANLVTAYRNEITDCVSRPGVALVVALVEDDSRLSMEAKHAIAEFANEHMTMLEGIEA